MDSPYSYPDSVSSSPRSIGRASRGTVDFECSTLHQQQPWDQDQESLRGASVRFMCSYGGRILPRPHDNQLRYVCGDTRIVAVARNVSYSLLISKLSRLCGSAVTLKYQLPNEDLDALISVTTDEDLENMMDEYDRLQQVVFGEVNNSKPSSSSSSSSRLRLFLFPAKPESAANSLGSLLDSSKREHWFVDALNGVPVLTRGRSEVSSAASESQLDYLFGLDTFEDMDCMANQNQNQPQPARKSRMFVPHGEGLNQRSNEEAQSPPASPTLYSSPYCSTSSAPPFLDSHVAPVEPQQAGAIEMGDEGIDFSEGTPDHETQAANLESPGLRAQDLRLVFDDQMTKISRPAEAFQQVQISEKDASEGSQMQLDFGVPMKREGSVSNLSDDTRYSHNITTAEQLKQQESKTYPDANTKASTIMMQQEQQIPAEHYMEQSYPYPQPCWQVHEPHLDQAAIPFYVLPTHPVPSAVHSTGQPAGMPFQPMESAIVPFSAPAVYSAGLLTSRPAVLPGATIQVTRKLVTPQGPSYPAQLAAVPSKVPLHRARSVVTDMRTMMRPSQPPVIYMPPDQYGYPPVLYETNPAPPVYYTQKAAVMMPRYQTMAPVTTDLQSSSQAVPKIPKLARVGQSL